MGWISVVFVHKAIEAALHGSAPQSALKGALFEMVGVDETVPPDPGQMIPDTAFFELLERIADAVEHGRSVPIRMGAAMRCDDYGAFGLAFKSAPDLLGSYRRVERYGKVVTSIANFRVELADDKVSFEVIPGRDPRLGLTMTNELAVAAATAISREVSTAGFAPAAVYFSAPRPGDTAARDAHFQCPVHDRASRDAIVISLETARRPNRLADDGLSRFFEAHLDRELSAFDDPTRLDRRVLDQIGSVLSEGVPTLAEVAERLGMSSRTLQRRLSDAGLAYQDLVTEARKSLCENLLRRTDYALAEIAFLTGFSDQSTFSRAFKRWHGQTPASYRRGN